MKLNTKTPTARAATLASLIVVLGCGLHAMAQMPDDGPDFGGPPPMDGGFGGSPPGGPGGMGFGPGGGGPPPGGTRERTRLVDKFDKDGNHWLNAEERKAARESLSKQPSDNQRRRGPGGPGGGGMPGGPRRNQEPAQPGPHVTPADVKSYPDAPLYATNILRTLFLDFESADWEKELADFKTTDVEIPVKLTVDGKTYANVGVRFHGNSSYFMIGEGHKRSLGLSMDLVDEKQRLYGYKTLNLLNANEDPTFMRAVLYSQTAREYIAAPKANWVRVVINGESWGVYQNVQQFNKEFLKEAFGSKKGARWKVPGSPNGQGGMNYLGEDVAAYKRIFEIKSEDDPKAWADLIKLCKTLNETPADKLEAALAPMLDIDATLKFLALDNALINNDGFWTRASDYDIFEDEQGKFHIIPYDINEAFSRPGGPGGPGGFGPGMFIASQILAQGDKNNDQKLTKEELSTLADAWFDKLDPYKAGKLSQDQFVDNLGDILPSPPGRQGRPGPQGQQGASASNGKRNGNTRGQAGPEAFIASGIFSALDANHDSSLTRAEMKDTFAKWAVEWDTDKSGALTEDKLTAGLNAALPMPAFDGPGRGPGGQGGGQRAMRGPGGPGGPDGQGGRRGPGGPGMGGGAAVKGVELDPLVAANDTQKPLISKLLAVPALKAKYLGYVREIAEKSLDWKKLGPIVQQYQALLAPEVKADTRKLESYEAFLEGLSTEAKEQKIGGRQQSINLKNFADQRRAYLLNYSENQKPAR